jgi:hypothetical protein
VGKEGGEGSQNKEVGGGLGVGGKGPNFILEVRLVEENLR